MRNYYFVGGFCFSEDFCRRYFPETITMPFISPSASLEEAGKLVLESPKPVVLVAWSLGGSLALSLKLAYPEKIIRVIMISQRPEWSAAVIEKERINLSEMGSAAYLLDFYSRSLKGSSVCDLDRDSLYRSAMNWSNEEILNQLQMLAHHQLQLIAEFPSDLHFLHARFDPIAPLQEIRDFCAINSLPFRILNRTLGHFPFASDELWEWIART